MSEAAWLAGMNINYHEFNYEAKAKARATYREIQNEPKPGTIRYWIPTKISKKLHND